MKNKIKNKCFLPMLLLMMLLLFVSCTPASTEINISNEVDVPNEMDMYREYILADDVLKNAGLPIVKIQTEDNKYILNKEEWVSASIDIVSDQVNWNIEDKTISIRGRGNTSWFQSKRPYAIKFDQKTVVCGMPKHKRWVLIANYLDNSFMKNEMAFYLSRKFEMDYTVRGQYVNLVLNGNYVGLYWLGEQIKVDKNRVDIDEENDFLIEMDVCFDETWKFKSKIKKMPIQIKNDDAMTEDRLEYLKNKINNLETVLYSLDFPQNDYYKNLIDIESYAKFYLINEIMSNGELGHPRSTYFTFDKTNEILKAGPVWDFDWAGHTTSTNIGLKGTLYYDALFKTNDFKVRLKELLSSDGLTVSGVSERIDELYALISKSAKLDRDRWGHHKNPVGDEFSTFDEYVDNLKACINIRLSALKSMAW